MARFRNRGMHVVRVFEATSTIEYTARGISMKVFRIQNRLSMPDRSYLIGLRELAPGRNQRILVAVFDNKASFVQIGTGEQIDQRFERISAAMRRQRMQMEAVRTFRRMARLQRQTPELAEKLLDHPLYGRF